MKRGLTGIVLMFVLVTTLIGGLFIWKPWVQKGQNHLKLAVVTWVGFGPFYIAQDKGFFKQEGLDVQLVRIDDFGARRAALASGSLDGSVETVDSLAIGLAAGLPAVQVLIVDESFGGDGIVANKNIKNIKDLAGKTVACAKGTPSHFFLLYLLNQAGVSPSEVTIKPMEAGDAGAAFVAQQVDAAVTWEPWLSKAKESHHGHVLTTTAEHPGVIADTFVVHPDLVRNNPKAVKGILRAWFKAINYLNSNKADSIAIMAKHLQLPPQELEGMLMGVRFPDLDANLKFLGVQGGDNKFGSMFSAAAKLWKDVGLIPQSTKLDPTTASNSSFLQTMNEKP